MDYYNFIHNNQLYLVLVQLLSVQQHETCQDDGTYCRQSVHKWSTPKSKAVLKGQGERGGDRKQQRKSQCAMCRQHNPDNAEKCPGRFGRGICDLYGASGEPGAVAVVPGLIGRMQAKGPALPSAQQPPAPLSNGVQICVNFILMKMALQGLLQCKVIVSLLPLPSFSSLFFLLPSSFFPLPFTLMCYCSAPRTPSKSHMRQLDDVPGFLKTIFYK